MAALKLQKIVTRSNSLIVDSKRIVLLSALLCVLAAIIACASSIPVYTDRLMSQEALIATRKAYERGREIWFDPNLGRNGRSCESCHSDGNMTRAENYPRYKHILRTMATISMTHNFAVVNESKGKPWVIGSEDANAITLFVYAFANGKKLRMEEPQSVNEEWITKGERYFTTPELGSNGKSCADCHITSRARGQRGAAGGPPLKGVAAYYPKYSKHFGRVIILEQQMHYCIEQFMQGTPPAFNSEPIVALYCYLADISAATPVSVARFE